MKLIQPEPRRNFEGVPVKLHRVGSDESYISVEQMHKIMSSCDIAYSYVTPLVTGYTYSVHWNRGIDFQHLNIQASSYFTPEDKGIVFRFNYTA